MAIRSSNKISAAFNMASMTDMVFLLLIFFMITSTLVSPNALKLLLPQSNNQTSAKAITSVSITKDLHYYIETTPVALADLERQLQIKLMDAQDPTISLHADRIVPVEEVVKVMNIAARNKYKLILATTPERRP
jgi:biopolymer transport protein ExbD